MAKYPLVLVPALGSDERLWQPVIDRLDGVTCAVIRGDGDSVEAMAEAILAEAPDEFHLAGISMGGYVSLELALRRTGRVRSLALLNTSAAAAAPERRESSLKVIELARTGAFDQAVGLVSAGVAPGHPDVVEVAARMSHDLGAEVFIDHQLAVLNRRDRTEEVAELDLPTLVLVGDADGIVSPAMGGDLAARVPNAEFVTLDGVGHLCTLEDPERVARAIQGWLARTEGRVER
ncbi:alpha/beta fold hydrolase [Nocardia fusca]|uniref:alpha/beta fold hydrolase n=1 Tax=Nocardia fusca TaxID=941183 RepID=UPI003792FBA6